MLKRLFILWLLLTSGGVASAQPGGQFPTGGLRQVSHDATLTGNGTPGSVLGIALCGANEMYQMNGGGTAWTCAAVPTGDITAVTVTAPISGGGTSGSVSVGLTLCGANQVYKMNPGGSAWACDTDASGSTISGLTTNTLTVATSSSSIGNSIAVQSGTAITVTDTLRATAVAHAPEVRWGAATDGTTGKFSTSGGVVTYLDFIDDLQLRIADNSYISPLQISNVGTSTFNYNVNVEGNLQLDNVGDVTFSSTGTAGGAVDLAISRQSANVLEVNNGTASTLRDLNARTIFSSPGATAYGMSVNSGATPGWSHFYAQANSTGGLSLQTYAADNSMVGFDLVYANNIWTARDTTLASIFKTNDELGITGIGGTSAGANVSSAYGTAVGATGYFVKWSLTTGAMSHRTAATFLGDTTHGDAAADNTYFHSTKNTTTNVGQFGFSSTALPTGAVDVGFGRNSAGVAEVNNGTGGQYRDLNLRKLYANEDVEINRHTLFGDFRVDDSTGATAPACGGIGPTVYGGRSFGKVITVQDGFGDWPTTCQISFSAAYQSAKPQVCVVTPTVNQVLYMTTQNLNSFTISSSTGEIRPFNYHCGTPDEAIPYI